MIGQFPFRGGSISLKKLVVKSQWSGLTVRTSLACHVAVLVSIVELAFRFGLENDPSQGEIEELVRRAKPHFWLSKTKNRPRKTRMIATVWRPFWRCMNLRGKRFKRKDRLNWPQFRSGLISFSISWLRSNDAFLAKLSSSKIEFEVNCFGRHYLNFIRAGRKKCLFFLSLAPTMYLNLVGSSSHCGH